MRKILFETLICFLLLLTRFGLAVDHQPIPNVFPETNTEHIWDLIVYDSTPSGIVAAVSAARLGKKVVLLSPTHHLGGMCSGGLGSSDVGPMPDQTIGGLALEFFQRHAAHYRPPHNHPKDYRWKLEPHVAEGVFREMLRESRVTVVESSGHITRVTSDAEGYLQSLTTENGNDYHGNVFIDASYEGDLLAKSNVEYTIGREGITTYGESYAGNLAKNDAHEFFSSIDPFDKATGTLLPYLMTNEPSGVEGEGDRKVQSYNFRLCVSKDYQNRAPFEKPANYDPGRWELFRRYVKSLPDPLKQIQVPPCRPTPLHNGKYDCNNNGPISTDFVGGSWAYPEATYEGRRRIWEQHKQYTLELFWFIGHDESVPLLVQQKMQQWGLCADEFNATNHWPPQLYVREARRMVGQSVFTQVDIEMQKQDIGLESIGLGSYNYDSHTAQRFPWNCTVLNSTRVLPCAWNEGDLERNPGPYQIPVSVVLPRKDQVKNLLVSVCLSASHVAFSSLRMEPQFMVIGQAAGIIAALTSPGDPVQNVNRTLLRKLLIQTKQIVDRVNSSSIAVS
jgi:hypothetical protein